MIIAVSILALLFAWLAWRDLAWAIYLLAAFLPAYLIRFNLGPLPLTLLEVMVLIIFAVFIGKQHFNWVKQFRQHDFFWPLLALLAAATVAMLVSPNLRGAAGVWKAYFIEPVLFYLVFINVIKTKQQLTNVFWALGASAVYLSVIALWQFGSGWNVPDAFLNPDSSVDRVVSVFGYPNALGLYLSPIILLFTGFLFWSGRGGSAINHWPATLLKLSIITLAFTTIILAESEAAVLSVLAIWLLWGVIYKKTRYYFTTAIVLIIIVAIFAPPINGYLTEKLLLQDYSGSVRLLIWSETGQMLKDNWLWGAGLAGYQTKIVPYHTHWFEIFLYPHNIILNFWSELGLLGLAAFAWLIILFAWKNLTAYLKNNYNLLNLTILLIVGQMLIHGLVDAPYLKNDLAVLFWLIVGVYVINAKIVNRHS